MNNFFMGLAYKEAEEARKKGEIPVGAVIVKDNRVIGKGHNLREIMRDVTYHAEIIAIKKANDKIKQWRLKGTTMYVTLEPCPMCAGAIVQSRIDTVVIGARDLKMGACGTVINLLESKNQNHNTKVIWGVMEEKCSKIIKDFFKLLRENKKSKEYL